MPKDIVISYQSKYGRTIPLRYGHAQTAGWSHISLYHMNKAAHRGRSKFFEDTNVKQLIEQVLMNGVCCDYTDKIVKLVFTFENPVGVVNHSDPARRTILVLGRNPVEILTFYPIPGLKSKVQLPVVSFVKEKQLLTK